MRTNLAFFSKLGPVDREWWEEQARAIEENLYDATNQDGFTYGQAAIDQKLRWIWSLRRQIIAYDRAMKEGKDAASDS